MFVLQQQTGVLFNELIFLKEELKRFVIMKAIFIIFLRHVSSSKIRIILTQGSLP